MKKNWLLVEILKIFNRRLCHISLLNWKKGCSVSNLFVIAYSIHIIVFYAQRQKEGRGDLSGYLIFVNCGNNYCFLISHSIITVLLSILLDINYI